MGKIKGKILFEPCNFSTLAFVPLQNHFVYEEDFSLSYTGYGLLYLLAQKTISDLNAEKETIGSFHGINVATGIKLIITEGSTEEVAVSASKPGIPEKIVTEVVNGTLKIYYDKKLGAINKKDESKNLKAYVSYKTLSQLDVTTGAEVEINGILTSSSLDLTANTGGLVKGEINVTTFKVSQNTGSRSPCRQAESLDVEGDTGSKFLGEDLKTTNCSANVSTGARIFIRLDKELNAKASTGGDIKYKGGGGIRDIKTSTGGSVL
ncbi:MAG: head GIN domain-containing protein [Bacteroidota bacterium]